MLRSMLVTLVALALAVPPAFAATGRITCSSNGYRYSSCGVASQGHFRDGFVHWNNGSRWWLGREGPGVMLGDIDSSKRYFFTRT